MGLQIVMGCRVLKYLYEFFKNFEKTEWSVMIGHKASRNKFPEKLSNDTVCSIIKLSA